MLTYLSHVYEALGTHRVTRRLLPTLPLQLVGRTLIWTVLRREPPRRDDVTVVLGVRNRTDYRLVNALRSIRGQTYPAELVKIVLVDYGSEPASARRTQALCEEHRAEYVRVDDVSVWSRSRCLNVGIRRADTKFVMTSDVDVVLSPRYLSDAIRVLNAAPLSIACSAMLDLPEESAEVLERSARAGEEPPLTAWKASCHPRKGWVAHPSICVARTTLFQTVRGLDEYYEVWGCEDDDLMRRFWYLGLRRKTVGAGSFYMHQWHEASERGRTEAIRLRNRSHFDNSHSILRNDADWGLVVTGTKNASR